MKHKPHLLTAPFQVRAFLSLNPSIEIRWPASKPVKGFLVIRGNNPHNPGHAYGEYWLGITRGREYYSGNPYSKENPQYVGNLFNEKGDFKGAGFEPNGFIVPELATIGKEKRLLKRLRKKKLYYDNKDLLMPEQTEDCAKIELQISELELRLNG